MLWEGLALPVSGGGKAAAPTPSLNPAFIDIDSLWPPLASATSPEAAPLPQGFALCVWTGSKQGRSMFCVKDCAPGWRCVSRAGQCGGGSGGVAWQARRRKEGRSRTISNLVRRNTRTKRPGRPKSRIWLREFHSGFVPFQSSSKGKCCSHILDLIEIRRWSGYEMKISKFKGTARPLLPT